MFARIAFGLAVVLASVSASLAAPRGQADTQTVYNPYGSGEHSRSESAPTVWGWPYRGQ
jgi:hypothetical protein